MTWGAVVVVLGLLIFIHELGHFLVAKYYRVGVLEFAIGFGPKLFTFRRGETSYSVRAIPLGGFVRMVGDDPRGVAEADKTGMLPEGEAGGASPIEGRKDVLAPEQEALLKDESRWLLKQPYWPKLAIVLAGPFFNLVGAWVLATGFYASYGVPEPVPIVGHLEAGLPGERGGLKVGDVIVSIDGKNIASWEELRGAVAGSGGKELAFSVLRSSGDPVIDPETAAVVNRGAATVAQELKLTPTREQTELDIMLSPEDASRLKIGIQPASQYRESTIFEAAYLGSLQVYGYVRQTITVLGKLATLAVSPRKVIGGPIEIVAQIRTHADKGIVPIIFLMIQLNIMLAVMNLLPIPVLDGGHVVLFTLEKLKGKPLSPQFLERATQVGLCLLLALMVFAIGNDIFKRIAS